MRCEIWTVLKTGGEYDYRHLAWLQRQLNVPINCLTDGKLERTAEINPLELKQDWPGWWSKIELFRPDISGNILYLDLDTVVLNLPEKYLSPRTAPIFLLDANRKHAGPINSGLMYIPRNHPRRHEPYFDMLKDPATVTLKFKGDQHYLDGYFKTGCLFWQELFPNESKSFKKDLRRGAPTNENIVFFHGQPRPWTVNAAWIPPLPTDVGPRS
jgi:hypothetical protein